MERRDGNVEGKSRVGKGRTRQQRFKKIAQTHEIATAKSWGEINVDWQE